MSKHIAIAIKGAGCLNVDQLKVDKIVLDNQAHRLLLRRAHEDGTTLGEAIEKTLGEAIAAHIAENTIT